MRPGDLPRALRPEPAPAVKRGETPAERFEAMLQAASPGSPLPASVLPLARELAPGRRPRLVTGASSRAALGAVGARAATVGDRIHLPHRPRAKGRDLGTLAHELTHVAERSATPRFLLKRVSGHLDAGERHARRVGSAAESAAGRARGGAERLRSSARSRRSAIEDRVGSVGDRVAAVGDRGRGLADEVGGRARELTSAGPALADRVRSSTAAQDARDRVSERLSTVSAGSMPIERAKAIAARGTEASDVVERGASAAADAGARGRQAVTRSVEKGRSRASDRRERLVRALGKAEGRVAETVQDARAVGAEAAGRTSSVAAAARARAKDAVDTGSAAATSATERARGGLDRAREGVDRARRDAGGAIDTARNSIEEVRVTDGMLDQLLERLEERVLDELQRRGGRYEGMF